jgi:hypothetical protein
VVAAAWLKALPAQQAPAPANTSIMIIPPNKTLRFPQRANRSPSLTSHRLNGYWLCYYWLCTTRSIRRAPASRITAADFFRAGCFSLRQSMMRTGSIGASCCDPHFLPIQGVDSISAMVFLKGRLPRAQRWPGRPTILRHLSMLAVAALMISLALRPGAAAPRPAVPHRMMPISALGDGSAFEAAATDMPPRCSAPGQYSWRSPARSPPVLP